MAKKPKTVGQAVAQLLQGKTTAGLSYEQIAERVRSKMGAKTTARSVASIASGLRAAGVDIPDHRRKTA